MGARASPRAWVRMVRGVNACSRHSRSARHVKGGWHKRAEPEPAELSLSRRRPVQPFARSLPFAGRQGSRVHVSCRGLLFKSARRAPSRKRPVRGRQAEARATSRGRSGKARCWERKVLFCVTAELGGSNSGEIFLGLQSLHSPGYDFRMGPRCSREGRLESDRVSPRVPDRARRSATIRAYNIDSFP